MAREISHAAPPTIETGSVEFIGNATLLLRFERCTILTDPSFLHAGDHVHVGYGLHARRLLEPSLQPSELPPLDGVVLSHLHGDHWDSPAEEALDHNLPIVTTLQAAQILRLRGFRRALPLKLWETTSLPEHQPSVMITAVPAQHGPKPVAMLLPETHGHVIETVRGDGKALKIYVSGDTVIHDALHEIPRRFPGIDVAFLHLGGTKIPSAKFGVMVTLDARGGVELVRIVQPNKVVPIHTDDWDLFSSGLEDFVAEMREQGLEDRLQIIKRGERVPL
jgi:L-ascorbate metabolism protein UlaG (beta-lactamase superfamily)